MSSTNLLEYKTLTLDHARTAIDAVIAAAKKSNFPGIAAVMVDKSGDIIASARMDGKAARFINAAHRKAYTAAKFELDTAGVIKFWKRQEANGHRGPSDWNDPMLTTLPGGYVVMQGQNAVGGFGVAGGFDPMPDEMFAEIGIASLGPGFHHTDVWEWIDEYRSRAKP